MNDTQMSPPRVQRRLRIGIVGLSGLLFLSGTLLSRQASGGVSDPVTGGIAAYFPDTAPNRAAITSRPGLGLVVMNTLQSAGAGGAVADYKGAGKRIFGYLAAGYAPSGANGISPKSLAQLQTTAAAMLVAYPSIDGLFLDEVLNNDAGGCSAPAAFYVGFYQWFKATYAAKSLILNPGTALCSSFAGSADIFVVFENRLSFYRSAFTAYFGLADFDWMRVLPNSQVWSIVYGVPVVDMAALMNELADYAGVVTVLSDNADHPYSNVPPAVELDLMNARATGAAVAVTTTTTLAVSTTTSTAESTTTTLASGGVGLGGGGGAVVPPGEPAATATSTTTPQSTTKTTTTIALVATTTTPTPPTTTPTTVPTTAPKAGPALASSATIPPRRSSTASVTNYATRYVTRYVKRTRCQTVRSKATGKRYRACKKVRVPTRVLVKVKVKVKS